MLKHEVPFPAGVLSALISTKQNFQSVAWPLLNASGTEWEIRAGVQAFAQLNTHPSISVGSTPSEWRLTPG